MKGQGKWKELGGECWWTAGFPLRSRSEEVERWEEEQDRHGLSEVQRGRESEKSYREKSKGERTDLTALGVNPERVN